MSSIEWTDETWNPTTGCDRVSSGCDSCYALTMARRLKAMGNPKYQRDGDPRTSGPGFGVSSHDDILGLPLRWRKPRRIFVNSMSDLFHDAVPDEYIARVFAVMAQAQQHTFQILTKRHARMRSLLRSEAFRAQVAAEFGRGNTDVYQRHLAGWPLPNVWLGVSVEDQRWADIRVPALLETPAAVRFLSCEPLLGPVDLTRIAMHNVGPVAHWEGRDQVNALTGAYRVSGERHTALGWVICGGESGPGARPMHTDWARSLRDQCQSAGVAFHFKQHGAWVAAPSSYGPDVPARARRSGPESYADLHVDQQRDCWADHCGGEGCLSDECICRFTPRPVSS